VLSSKSTDFGSATVSSKRSEPLDLERDLPTTAEDVAALRRIRESRQISFADYLRFLSRLELPAAARRRKPPESDVGQGQVNRRLCFRERFLEADPAFREWKGCETLAAFTQQIPQDDESRDFGGELPDAGCGRMKAQLQGLEVEAGLPLDDQLPVDDGALGKRFEKRGLELGEYRFKGLRSRLCRSHSFPSRKTRTRKPSNFGSKIQESPAGRASTSFASIGSTGGWRGSSTPR
jgi:hypothetical protein